MTLLTFVYCCSVGWIIVGFNKSNKRVDTKIESKVSKKISIVIAVRNEENNILNCLRSITSQNYDTDNFEVIIVNDQSTDRTKDIVNEFISNCELNIQLHEALDGSGKKQALRYGIEQSNYELIATTDADCILPSDWLSTISLLFNSETEMLIGPIMFKENKGFLSNFQSLDMMAIQGMEFGTMNYNKPVLNNAANLSYLKSTFKEVGGLDTYSTPSGDDIFLLEKFKLNNKKIKGLLTRGFIVLTESESTFSGFLNQRIRWSSKGKYYSDKLLISLSTIVLLQNISMMFIYLCIPLVENYSIILIILLFCKWLIDFILLFLVASFYERRKTLFYFIPVQLVYPIYIFVIWIASMTIRFEWKGRKF